MSASRGALDAAAIDRKARLAKLASLKRKQPGSDSTVSSLQADTEEEHKQIPPQSTTNQYLSGRNYDPTTKSAKLGFENAPIGDDVETLEGRADRIVASTAEQAAKYELEAEKGIDLFKLQPGKPNWDLKRNLAEKMKILDVRTQNAIARLVRERIENSKKHALERRAVQPQSSSEKGEQGEEVGIEGSTLVESIHLREQEEEREAALENEEDAIS
ncbi:uncharacterized protein Z519_02585 [Cladophialophora bantiana CBS 173.52]|uniref:Cwf18 pre-mRNA splicing factor n=1 Tax=Cladophialophora bantiana (strain ATCC 10958 / CBS 173.52 / CDC B-1940 / NIH 8579) TaxID=1442370 RepID=A0A0D2HUZ7_CLAB1|nr:uncharacterized protein Z519_02585 [Cladophialophora bantiana CBS 173.52]KIW97193.1 hypothetical protein Z519_02585 [Cladophialophora bantiana CBS 173.52]